MSSSVVDYLFRGLSMFNRNGWVRNEDISYPGLTRMSDKPMHPRHMAPYSMHEANVI